MWTNGYFRRTFGFGRKHSYHIRCTFGFVLLQLVNSVVAESRVQSLSCGGRECAIRMELLASLCTDWLCKDIRGSWLRYLRLHLVLWLVGSDRLALITLSTFGFGFGFRRKVPLYFRWRVRFRPNVLRHFRPTFGFGRNKNFLFRSTSKYEFREYNDRYVGVRQNPL